MSTKTARKIKEVKQAIPASRKINENEAIVVTVTDEADKKFLKKLAKKHLIAKRREDELKQLKKQFLNEIVTKYVSEKDKKQLADFDENKYIEFISDSDAVRDNIQYDCEYNNGKLLKIATKRDILEKVATVSISKIRPFLNKGEEEDSILEKKITEKITVSKK